KSAPAGHTTAAAHLLWQVFPRYPCLEYKDNSGQSCPVRYTWTASFGCRLMFWQKWFYLTPQFVAYQFPGHLLHPYWYFTAYSSICQVLLGALSGSGAVSAVPLLFFGLDSFMAIKLDIAVNHLIDFEQSCDGRCALFSKQSTSTAKSSRPFSRPTN